MQYGLIGGRLGHSYSVEIHAAAADYEYELKELAPGELGDFFKKREFKGINVTIPYKQTVMPFLDEISETAKSIGAVNTVVNENGKLTGHNTDFFGMSSMLRANGIDLKGRKVLILGTGGTSKTARYTAKELGADEIIVVSRKKSADTVNYEEEAALHSAARVIINTTPVGMFPDDSGVPVDISAFPALEGVADAVYHPLRTNLVLSALEKGIPACGGLYMLAAQGVLASALFLGRGVDESLIEKAFTAVEKSKMNVVLTGMPTSGKSSVGKLIAERTGREFFDTDDITREALGMPIPDYIRIYGEESFRNAETAAIQSVSSKSGAVIATGGGAVLRDENVRALKRNGTLVFLDRSLQNLTAAKDRPLSDSAEKLKNLYETRLPIYRKTADFTADSNVSVTEVADTVTGELKL